MNPARAVSAYYVYGAVTVDFGSTVEGSQKVGAHWCYMALHPIDKVSDREAVDIRRRNLTTSRAGERCVRGRTSMTRNNKEWS